ncbi:MAG TPA: hypothetical protein VLS93_18395 [Anaeromyxobacteraceae bacterium]|nr:hypothetical protein [Anaeromyxobacteraceae bacterium]
MSARSRVAAAALALFLGCAGPGESLLPLTQVPAEPPPDRFVAKGEIQTRDRSAAFDDWRVVGPLVNMTRDDDGNWRGDLLGRDYVMKPGPGRLAGSGAELYFVRWGNEVVVRGHLLERRVVIRILPGEGLPTPSGIACRFDGNLIDCSKKSASVRQGVELRGQAANVAEPPLPQFALALVAAAIALRPGP